MKQSHKKRIHIYNINNNIELYSLASASLGCDQEWPLSQQMTAKTRHVYGRFQKPAIIVYKGINMDIFLTKMHFFASEYIGPISIGHTK